MKETYLDPIELYMKRAFGWIILLTPLAALCASLTFTVLKLCGLYPTVSWLWLIMFDITNILYMLGGIAIRNRSETDTGELNPLSLKMGKVYLAIVIFIQWNYISYLIPSIDFWAYACFFSLIAAFFVDHRYMLIVTAEILVSVAASWVLHKNELLPTADAYFVPSMVLRVVLMVIFHAYLWLMTYLVQTNLVRETEKLATLDSLTHLRNRRTLYTEMERMQKMGTYTLLMCDLDNFKSINDNYGHECGDEVLKYVAKVICANVRESDIVFRYGGEELLILVGADKKYALEIAERVRNALAEAMMRFKDREIPVTITIGAAEYDPNLSVDGLVDLADRRMYEGKQRGKNVVVG